MEEQNKKNVSDNLNDYVVFTYMGVNLSCTKYNYSQWLKLSFFEKVRYVLLTVGDLRIFRRCSYYVIKGKKYLIYKDNKYARL